jgi:hypothetical protein
MQQATVNLLADMGVQPRTLQAGAAGRQRLHRRHGAGVRPSSRPPPGPRCAPGVPVTVSGTAQGQPVAASSGAWRCRWTAG